VLTSGDEPLHAIGEMLEAIGDEEFETVLRSLHEC
jgi:hypothetical protein